MPVCTHFVNFYRCVCERRTVGAARERGNGGCFTNTSDDTVHDKESIIISVLLSLEFEAAHVAKVETRTVGGTVERSVAFWAREDGVGVGERFL